MNIDLSGRVAIVTGAASGLGWAAAERYRACGATVELWDIGATALTERAAALGGNTVTAVVDVSTPDEVLEAVARAMARHGRIDILLNSAGIAGPVLPCVDYPVGDWDRVIGINLTGVFLCCRAVIAPMVAAGRGRIINVASISGKEGNPDQIAYAASKAGVIGLTKALGKELARTGVTANAIAPGVFETPMAIDTAASDPEFMQRLTAKIPMGRMGRLSEFSALAAWIASDECSFTTGFTFDLTGGRATY